ncbi:helix-turn-helix domain-containing protein [Bradyrhizobium sp.]|uniref:helix-turn-helix domain-containing protein n=1 Tax=Bradyrhizobium sp. TaxID=376 RepID=UPI0039E451A8
MRTGRVQSRAFFKLGQTNRDAFRRHRWISYYLDRPVVRGVDIRRVDHTRRSVIAFGDKFLNGCVIEPHHHRRGQLICGATGLIVLSTSGGTWVMPPQRGMWIPPGVIHQVRMVGDVFLLSLYIEPDAIEGMPNDCQVVTISPFLRSLMSEAIELPLEYNLTGRSGALMELVQHEMRQCPALPLSLHFPAEGRLSVLCRQFVERPNIHETVDSWADALGMSRRSFTRMFRRELGMSFIAWRQQACLMCAMPRLAAGQPVSTVAFELGYESPAAFTLMFRRAFGNPPLVYLGLR